MNWHWQHNQYLFICRQYESSGNKRHRNYNKRRKIQKRVMHSHMPFLMPRLPDNYYTDVNRWSERFMASAGNTSPSRSLDYLFYAANMLKLVTYVRVWCFLHLGGYCVQVCLCIARYHSSIYSATNEAGCSNSYSAARQNRADPVLSLDGSSAATISRVSRFCRVPNDTVWKIDGCVLT